MGYPRKLIGNGIVLLSWLLLSAAFFVPQSAAPQTTPATVSVFPRIAGDSLAGKKVTLPDDARGKVTLVAIGFSHKSGETVRAWTDRFRKDFGDNPKYAIYPVAELEGAPRLIRGMILGGMRRGTPAAEQDHFLTLFQGDAELKKFADFSGADDSYLFLLDATGVIQWRGHALLREEEYLPLQKTAKKLASQ